MERALHIIVEKKSLTLSRGLSSQSDTSKPLEQWHGQQLPAPVTLVGATGSVLDDAWQLVAQDALPLWGSVLAESQNAGRGQTRRQWHSPQGNIYAALRLPAQGIFSTTAAAPALSTLLLLAMQNMACPLRLKWPNDLVLPINNHKVGGILLEERQGILLAGIGINVSHAPQENILRKNHALSAGILPHISGVVDSVTLLNDSVFDIENAMTQALWLHLVSHIYFCYKSKLLDDGTWKDLAESFLLWHGQHVELDDGQEKIYGILHGLGNLGEIVMNIHGRLQQYTSGSLRLKNT